MASGSTTLPISLLAIDLQGACGSSGAPQAAWTEALSVLLTAHTSLVDDWVPFDRYTAPFPAGASVVTWRGPEFLMRAYARSLRHLGLQAEECCSVSSPRGSASGVSISATHSS